MGEKKKPSAVWESSSSLSQACDRAEKLILQSQENVRLAESPSCKLVILKTAIGRKMTLNMMRKKGIDTNQYEATISSYGAELLIEEGKWTEENPCLAKPLSVKSCLLNTLETKETLMML